MMSINNNIVLILTGCVIPNVDDDIVVADYNIRKQMYIDSIKWYLIHTNYKIVFCENSGIDLSDFFTCDIDNGRLEILTYKSSKENADRSKGYKEMEIMEHVYRDLKFVKWGDSVKITERLKLLNIREFIPFLESVLVKNKTGFVSAFLNGKRPGSDCRFFFFSYEFFPFLLSMKERICYAHCFEHVLADSVAAAKQAKLKFAYPNHVPRVDGIGSMGYVYNISDKQYYRKDRIHQLRRVLFNIGILPLHRTDKGNRPILFM